MARVFIDGFENNNLNLWDAQEGCVLIAAKTGMSGSYCVDATGMGDYLHKVVSARVDYYVAMKWYLNNMGSYANCCAVTFMDPTVGHCMVAVNDSGNIVARRISGTSDVLLATGTATLSKYVTYLIEIYALIDDTNGRIIVKLNGITDIDFTGDTRNGGAAQIVGLRFGGTVVPYRYGYAFFDDIIIDNANWIGSTSITKLVVTADGDQNDFTPTSGNNWECVEDGTDADSISSNTNDHVDLFQCANIAVAVSSIKAVQVQASAKKQGSSSLNNLKIGVRSGGTNYFSANKSLATALTPNLLHIWETDPATAVAWTESGVNSMEIGVKAAT